jgi:RNA polymerase-binding transcription factor DksA
LDFILLRPKSQDADGPVAFCRGLIPPLSRFIHGDWAGRRVCVKIAFTQIYLEQPTDHWYAQSQMAVLVVVETKQAARGQRARAGQQKRETMETETKYCRICNIEIPKERLEAMPETLVCVNCSARIGGEFKLQVTMGSTGKAGSLKKTGQELSVQLKPRISKWEQRIPRGSGQ